MKLRTTLFPSLVAAFFFVLFLLPSSVSATVLFTDDFTDTDSTTLPSHDSDWSMNSGSLEILTNQLHAAVNGEAQLNNHVMRDGCTSYDVQFPLTDIVYNMIRVSGDGNANRIYSYLNPANNGIFLGYQTYYGPVTWYDGQIPSLSNGMHNYKLCAIGDRLSVKLDDVVIFEHMDHLSEFVKPAGNAILLLTTGTYADNYQLEEMPQQSPAADISNGATIPPGGTYTATASFTDSDSARWDASVDYGDGSDPEILETVGATKSFELNHTYPNPGTYTVTFSVSDMYGGTDTPTATVIVVEQNSAPTVGSITTTPNPVSVNASTTASASFADVDASDTHTASWDWGDGDTTAGTVTESNGSGSVSNSHTYPEAGTYTITLTVTDSANASTQQTISVTVVNQLTALAPAQVYISRALPVIRFDLRAEVYKDSTLVSSGQINSVAPGSGATLASIPFNSFSVVDFPTGSDLKVVVSVRNACTGSILNFGNATLYYNNTPVDSRFDATIGNVSSTYHLRNAAALSTTAGTSQNTSVVAAGAKCSPFKPFGTWTINL